MPAGAELFEFPLGDGVDPPAQPLYVRDFALDRVGLVGRVFGAGCFCRYVRTAW